VAVLPLGRESVQPLKPSAAPPAMVVLTVLLLKFKPMVGAATEI
jgi:hypothetical protein